MRTPTIKRLIFATTIAAAVSGTSVSLQAADFGPGYYGPGKHVRTASRFSNWRDRCAYAGYYCLYAWDGYVYHYPFDDRPWAWGHRRYRYRG